jgi:hypothetical protein
MQASGRIFGWFCLILLNGLGVAVAADFSTGAVKDGHCDLVLYGDIKEGDEAKFMRALSALFQAGCTSPTVSLYSRGGSVAAAIKIAEQVFALRLHVTAPTLVYQIGNRQYSPDGPRYCPKTSRAADRVRRDFATHQAQFDKALKYNLPLPDPPPIHGDYDPRVGIGDPNCTCASSCFFIWAAGAERDGDVIVVHRPYFEPKLFAELGADEAQTAYKKLADNVREFLVKVGVPSSLIEKMMSVDSEHGLPLTANEISSLRVAPYWQELKLANCPVDDVDVLSQLDDPAEVQEVQQMTRNICWTEKQGSLREPLIEAYLNAHAGARALLELYARRAHVDPDDPGLGEFIDCRRRFLGACDRFLDHPHPRKDSSPEAHSTGHSDDQIQGLGADVVWPGSHSTNDNGPTGTKPH